MSRKKIIKIRNHNVTFANLFVTCPLIQFCPIFFRWGTRTWCGIGAWQPDTARRRWTHQSSAMTRWYIWNFRILIYYYSNMQQFILYVPSWSRCIPPWWRRLEKGRRRRAVPRSVRTRVDSPQIPWHPSRFLNISMEQRIGSQQHAWVLGKDTWPFGLCSTPCNCCLLTGSLVQVSVVRTGVRFSALHRTEGALNFNSWRNVPVRSTKPTLT